MSSEDGVNLTTAELFEALERREAAAAATQQAEKEKERNLSARKGKNKGGRSEEEDSLEAFSQPSDSTSLWGGFGTLGSAEAEAEAEAHSALFSGCVDCNLSHAQIERLSNASPHLTSLIGRTSDLHHSPGLSYPRKNHPIRR